LEEIHEAVAAGHIGGRRGPDVNLCECAQVRTSSDGRSLQDAQPAPERGRAIEVAPPIIATLGDSNAVDILYTLDPWSGASTAYKGCPEEKDKASCLKRRKCGYDANVKKCDNAACSEKQLDRVRKAGDEKRALERY